MKELENPNNGETITSFEEFDSACSTPYVSAPSSPGRGPPISGGFFYSAPASPVHFMLSNSTLTKSESASATSSPSISSSFEFDFSARYTTLPDGTMSSADELFSNGQIRPMTLSSHLKRPQVLAPLIDADEIEDDCDDFALQRKKVGERGRDLKMRNRSLRGRTRSMSPLRTAYHEEETEIKEEIKQEEAPTRSTSAGRSSNRWVFLKEFLYRSKSEGSNTSTGKKLWSSMSFSPIKDKKMGTSPANSSESPVDKAMSKKSRRRRLGLSAHELHYTANRAQAEDLRKKTFLPYKRGLLGCLGFSSNSYGAMNGLAARAFNPVSSK
ncbi:hypothetical protein LguiA_008135 [Lonicera macranthoides]